VGPRCQSHGQQRPSARRAVERRGQVGPPCQPVERRSTGCGLERGASWASATLSCWAEREAGSRAGRGRGHWAVLAWRETGRRGRTGWAGKEEEVGCWVGLGFWFSFLFSFSKHTQTNFEFKSNLNSNPMHSIKYNLCTSMNAQTCYLKNFYFLVKIN